MASAPLKVLATQDNKNGTSTNYLSDGSSDTGTYTKNSDGTLNFKPIAPLVPSQAPVTPIAPNTAIPLSTLQAPVVAPAQTGQVPIPTAADGAQAYIQSAVTDPYIAGLQQQASQAGTASTSSLEALLREQLGAPTQSGLESQAYAQKGGVNDSTAALNDITNQLTAEQVSTRHQIEKLQKNNPLGKSADAIQQQVNDLNSQSLSRQADLAVTQLAAQGKVALAKQIADRSVDGIMEAEKQRLSVLNTIYQNNKDIFDKQDQRAFESAQAERQTQAANDEWYLRAQFDEKIRESSPDYALGLEAQRASIAASRASTAKTYADIAASSPAAVAAKTAAASAESAGNALAAVKTANKQVSGLSSGVLANATGWTGLNSAKNNLESTLDTVKSSLTFDTLAQLKANSPTGASGLGALSDNEGKLLASQVASLSTSQSPAQLKKNLAIVHDHYISYLTNLGYGYDDATGTVITP